MDFYRFVSTDGQRRVLAGDKAGVELPTPEQWNFLGPMMIDGTAEERFGLSAAGIRETIAEEGFFLLPANA